MQFKALLAFLPLLATAVGYVIPEGTPDGFYIVTFDESGNSTTQRLIRPLSPPLASPSKSDYNACTTAWRNYFTAGNKVGARSIMYATSGQATLAGCNYYPFARAEPGNLVDLFNGHLDNNVGWWKTGWVHYYSWSNYDFVFARELVGSPICTNM
ncbi:hypothetical protein B0T21DRAFT_446669 [Apiosordaria backusii]|uniref:Uncharacterized protein n=1 Tax=Apiosordaria backusii TaxID=314023 RepID=A0AA40EYE0_9PEZI|nr:hypothetical protein B0T21DRAFT_446669 [Apiosordaria backusii]